MPHDPPALSPSGEELAPTQVDVSDLIDSPGASRPVELDVAAPAGFEIPLTELGPVIEVDGVLESLVDGILLRGSVAAELVQTCARCLTDLEPTTTTAQVAELYSDPTTLEDPSDVEAGYVITDGSIDIDAMLRDTLAQATAVAPLCRADCAGLCPTCGIDRNQDTCDCADDPVDDRWSALSDLKLNP
jgi:uncharacterized protein